MVSDDPSAMVYRAVDLVSATREAGERAQLATQAMYALAAAAEELRDLRRDAVIELRDSGESLKSIGDLLGGLGRSRVSQIIADTRSARRPGVIEMQTRLTVAQLRAAGSDDEEVVRQALPQVLASRGGERLTVEQLADLLGVEPAWLLSRLPEGKFTTSPEPESRTLERRERPAKRTAKKDTAATKTSKRST
jgi:hypothetical protein